MKRLAGIMLVALCGLVLLAGAASAKDAVLEQDMADLEKAYIPALFYTSAQDAVMSVKAMKIYKAAWREFSETYYGYRPDYENWKQYFDLIQHRVEAADAIVASGVDLVMAHEELEMVRMIMLQMRPRNGFPWFVTDKLTAFHEPMEGIVLAVKGKTPDQIDEALLVSLEEMLDEAWFTWNKVEQAPVDQALWRLTDMQMSDYFFYRDQERKAFQDFEAALLSGDKAAIIQKGVAVKPFFVKCYTTFGNFAAVMKAQ